MLSTILIIVLILLLIGALPTWPYSSGWGYYPGGGLGLVLIIVLDTGAIRQNLSAAEFAPPSLRGAKRRSNPARRRSELDCFAPLAMTSISE